MSNVLEHTNQPGQCFADSIKSLAEHCDHEYYMSGIGPHAGNLERAKRGRLRILEGITELESIDKSVSCLACHYEIQRQIKLQKDGVLEIERVWNLSR